MTDSEVLRAFESLGDNCEFGLVQSSLGIEQLGFFRFNSVSAGALLRALDNGFADFENLAGLDIEIACNDELIVHIPGYGLRYHTFYKRGDVDIDRLRRQQTTVVRYLARKLREDLRTAEKIFVRKSATASSEEIEALHAALRRHGETTLLWVTLADRDSPAGDVHMLRPGLLKSSIDRFSAYADATAASFAWFEICRAAHALWRGTVPSKQRPRGSRLYRIAALAELTTGLIADAGSVEPNGLGFAILQDAVVHGGHGIVTVGDAAVAETLPEQIGSSEIALRESPATPEVGAAYHLFGGVGEEEDSRAQAAATRFRNSVYDRFMQQAAPQSPPILLFPDMEGFGVLEALRALAPRHVPRLAVPADRAVRVQHLCLPYPQFD